MLRCLITSKKYFSSRLFGGWVFARLDFVLPVLIWMSSSSCDACFLCVWLLPVFATRPWVSETGFPDPVDDKEGGLTAFRWLGLPGAGADAGEAELITCRSVVCPLGVPSVWGFSV